MIDYQDILKYAPYDMGKDQKSAVLTQRLLDLCKTHYEKCGPYRRMLDGLGCDLDQIDSYDEIPFIPVSLFKELELLSVNKEEIFKIVTSSGTSNQIPSKIFLDKKTAANQQKTLARIVSDFTGKCRMPMLIIDSPSVIKDRTQFSARGAGIVGFSIFGTDKTYALKDDMTIDIEGVREFLLKHAGKTILLFGFTFMIWQYFYQELANKNIKVDLSNGILIHGGGWKKMKSISVPPDQFKQRLFELTGIKRVHDYYGMAEQVGTIYMECEYGHLHCSTYSDVIIRNPEDFSPCRKNETGIIQVLSALPESYPGHSLLTEDEGVWLGEDDCPCGRKGKIFKVIGRLKNAEIRGCSDTHDVTFR